jgi:hypothetical protein
VGATQNEVLVAESRPFASHGWMKNIHFPTILVTLGLVGLVAILSGQNMVGSPSVQVSNPLGVPGWVPSGVWMARHWQDNTGADTFEDYTVPFGHFALIRASSCKSSGTNVHLDDGSGLGFQDFFTWYRGGNIDPGVVVDEGTVIRIEGGSQYSPAALTGYLIPK